MRFVLFLFSLINLYRTLFNTLRKYLVLLYSRSTNLTKVMTGVSLVPVTTPVLCKRQSFLVCEKPAAKVTYIIADTMTPQMKSLSASLRVNQIDSLKIISRNPSPTLIDKTLIAPRTYTLSLDSRSNISKLRPYPKTRNR